MFKNINMIVVLLQIIVFSSLELDYRIWNK